LPRFIKRKPKPKAKIIIPHWNSCDFLPAWRFFAVLDNGNDYRYLLKCDELPEAYDYEYLAPVWDKLCNQYDKINGESTFKNSILDLNADILEINELTMLKAAYNLMLLGDATGCKYFGFDRLTPENVQKARSVVIKKETRLKIAELERSQGKSKTKSDENYYIAAIVWLSNLLDRPLDKDKLTVTEWLYWNKEAKKHIANLKRKHGRSNKA
jgi:hypothetical protein